MHNLGSRDWVSDERNPVPPLGEYDGPTQWDDGFPPSPVPLPLLFGSEDCIARGERLPSPDFPLQPIFTTQNYPAACFGAAQRQVLSFDLNDCNTVIPFATLSVLLYQDSIVAGVVLASYLGPTYNVFHVSDGVGTTPGSLIAVGERVIVVVSGTQSFSQVVVQALYLAFGITDFGGYSTLAAWETMAEAIEARMRTAGITAQTEFWYVGHSLGGAVAQVLAARMALNRPGVKTNVLTFGSPVAGDVRLNNYLETGRQRHFCNIDDPVPGVPPKGFNLIELGIVLGGALQGLWRELRAPSNRVIISPDFKAQDSGDDFLEYPLTLTIANIVAGGLPFPNFEVHSMNTYLFRLSILCSSAIVPKPIVSFHFVLTSLVWHGIGGPYTDNVDLLVIFTGVQWVWASGSIPPADVVITANSDIFGNWQSFTIRCSLSHLPDDVADFTWQFPASDVLLGITTFLWPTPSPVVGGAIIDSMVRMSCTANFP